MPAISYLSECAPAGAPWPTRYISPQIERILGFTPQEWLSDPTLWGALVDREDQERAAAADAEHYGGGEPLDIELRVHDKDGNVRWLRDQAVIIRDDDGAPLFSQGLMFDVTERKLAEERLADAEQRYRAIVEHIPAAIYLHRPTDAMETVYMSPQVADIVGVPPEAWIADPDLWVPPRGPRGPGPHPRGVPCGGRGARELASRVPGAHARRPHRVDPRRDDVPHGRTR
jgi:PAS domain S-box-containing protein